ncbi:bifunctional ADP-dependent NAD(P)H-hydrate dehydratase/NAD(P)H-hydrate epimerase [Mahella australiensis]|uniref:Bifunctional NAD(P)H-hydrate repair enzyme n=1 Tax=Mahella australiensis (strain DSM 15567 / CIP 107919 / 50-1 BON) TaxID=697281 RepID=F4A1A8_MAHA5|nr:bifunctional ADP-dependent NAD(P)H-hydrate dehydratase/NAD(P)H-hydrate epimerase [Mahella australiensis]AEE97027.1 carbohydrate kinase, YjeF related protein [Mahella australiensis 50-1 BON]
MKAVMAQQMRSIDRTAIERYGIPGIVLMENAALAVVNRVMRRIQHHNDRRAAIVCGGGNNGGDGLAVARHLHQHGLNVKLYLLTNSSKFKGDAAVNFNIIKNSGVPYMQLDDEYALHEFYADIKNTDVIIDAIFGTGIKGEVTDLSADVINAINESSGYVISVDMPSGINSDTGEVCGCAVIADETVTFVLPKIGQIVYPGKKHVGRLSIADICIPRAAIDDEDISAGYITVDDIALPVREADSHKGDYGHVLVVGGSVGFSGAPIMAAKAAMRSGAGMVTAVVPYGIYNAAAASAQEVMIKPVTDDGVGRISAKALADILTLAQKADVMVIGPGMQVYDEIFCILRNIIDSIDIPIIVDADGLNAIAQQKDLLKNSKGNIILTPHPGEMSRLTGLPIGQIQCQRIDIARDFARQHNVVMVLKGAATVTACPSGWTYINSTGNAGMATAGSGDVLTGVIAAMACQYRCFDKASYIGAFIHGLAGDKAVENKGMHGLVAGDIIEMIPAAIKYIYNH